MCGHAVGRKIHDEPYIPHIDMGIKGEKLISGMVIAIEPHISMGKGKIYLSKKDDYTYLSEDNAIELLDKVQYLSYVIHRYNLKKIPAEYYIA